MDILSYWIKKNVFNKKKETKQKKKQQKMISDKQRQKLFLLRVGENILMRINFFMVLQ